MLIASVTGARLHSSGERLAKSDPASCADVGSSANYEAISSGYETRSYLPWDLKKNRNCRFEGQGVAQKPKALHFERGCSWPQHPRMLIQAGNKYNKPASVWELVTERNC